MAIGCVTRAMRTCTRARLSMAAQVTLIACCSQALAQSAPEYIKYVYCGKPYAYEWGMNPDYVEDGVHPNQEGLELLAACIKKDVDTDMSSYRSN